VDAHHFDLIQDAMAEAIYGTAARAAIKDITIAGKTGTAQNPQGEDHSVFIAFAPKENPKIAIAVYVENAGWGGRAAASTASLMIEKYIRREVTRLLWKNMSW
jgi:penicillin-binding protein 2